MNKENCINALEYTEKRYRKVPILDSAGLNISAMCTDVLKVLENCIEIPDGATNGYMIKTLFPNARVGNIYTETNGEMVYCVAITIVDGFCEMRVMKSWWDAPFKTDELEKEEKNND